MKKLFLIILGIYAYVALTAATITIGGTVNDGFVIHPYTANLTASGGQTPYTWTIISSLPTGLSLQSFTKGFNATINGTPTTAGVYTYSIVVTDANAVTAQNTYTTTISYAYLSQGQIQAVWTRGVPSPPYIYDSFNSERPYTLYSALLSQTGTVTPTATILFNDLGATPTFAVDPSGIPTFSINIGSNLFTTDKTWFALSWPLSATELYGKVVYTSSSSLTVTSYTTGVLSKTPFEIRVYK